jgi:hypothetical protein
MTMHGRSLHAYRVELLLHSEDPKLNKTKKMWPNVGTVGCAQIAAQHPGLETRHLSEINTRENDQHTNVCQRKKKLKKKANAHTLS